MHVRGKLASKMRRGEDSLQPLTRRADGGKEEKVEAIIGMIASCISYFPPYTHIVTSRSDTSPLVSWMSSALIRHPSTLFPMQGTHAGMQPRTCMHDTQANLPSTFSYVMSSALFQLHPFHIASQPQRQPQAQVFPATTPPMSLHSSTCTAFDLHRRQHPPHHQRLHLTIVLTALCQHKGYVPTSTTPTMHR